MMITRRTSTPLIFAWATIMHKSQEQTISSLQVDLINAIEYVLIHMALGGALDMNSLHVIGSSRGEVDAEPNGVEYYEDLKLQLSASINKSARAIVRCEKSDAAYVGFTD